MFKNRLGVCCIILGDNASKFKTLQLTRIKSIPNPKYKIHETYTHNLAELCKVLDYLTSKSIFHYRISSNLFPLADHIDYAKYFDEFCAYEYNWSKAKQKVYDYFRCGGRLSTHPDQFCVISSSKQEVNESGMRILNHHAKMMDMLGCTRSYFCPINIHVSNGNSSELASVAAHKIMRQLPENVMSRLVFETEDKSYWTYQKLIKLFPNIPITLDYHHRLINNEGESELDAHNACVSTWKNVKPLFHYSEGKDSALDISHSDFVSSLPQCATGVDIEIEAKQKNLAVLKLLQTL
jgi:UV DNA damage endonuclease